jgi:hypothetical protein
MHTGWRRDKNLKLEKSNRRATREKQEKEKNWA